MVGAFHAPMPAAAREPFAGREGGAFGGGDEPAGVATAEAGFLVGPRTLHGEDVVRRDTLAERVETPLVLFDRHGTIPATMSAGRAEWPSRSPEWFEERFWIWIHYAASKIARGELFEALEMLAYLRSQVLGPMLSRNLGHRQRGLRRIETKAPAHVRALTATVARYDKLDCWRALEASVSLYRDFRAGRPPENLAPKLEQTVVAYIDAHADLGREPL